MADFKIYSPTAGEHITPALGKIKLGSSDVSKIYQGSTLVWPLGYPINISVSDDYGLIVQGLDPMEATVTGTAPNGNSINKTYVINNDPLLVEETVYFKIGTEVTFTATASVDNGSGAVLEGVAYAEESGNDYIEEGEAIDYTNVPRQIEGTFTMPSEEVTLHINIVE